MRQDAEALDEHVDHATDVIGPVLAALCRTLAGREFVDGVLVIKGHHTDDAVGPGGDGYFGGEVDGAGQHEAVVVVGVLTDQVDAAGGAATCRARTPKCCCRAAAVSWMDFMMGERLDREMMRVKRPVESAFRTGVWALSRAVSSGPPAGRQDRVARHRRCMASWQYTDSGAVRGRMSSMTCTRIRPSVRSGGNEPWTRRADVRRPVRV